MRKMSSFVEIILTFLLPVGYAGSNHGIVCVGELPSLDEVSFPLFYPTKSILLVTENKHPGTDASVTTAGSTLLVTNT